MSIFNFQYIAKQILTRVSVNTRLYVTPNRCTCIDFLGSNHIHKVNICIIFTTGPKLLLFFFRYATSPAVNEILFAILMDVVLSCGDTPYQLSTVCSRWKDMLKDPECKLKHHLSWIKSNYKYKCLLTYYRPGRYSAYGIVFHFRMIFLNTSLKLLVIAITMKCPPTQTTYR